MKMFEDTIIGISTAQSRSAISIIRLSGPDSIKIVNSCFKGKNLLKVTSHTINYGKIVDPLNNQIIDEVLVSVFRAPKSYTTEDVVEVNCHGGMFVTNQVYETLVLQGAKPAEPGEFTKRAFLNGRIDLTKAEATMDIIDAENKSALKLATKTLNGKISDFVKIQKEKLLNIISIISVNIDYPEYDDVEELTNEKVLPSLLSIRDELLDVLENAKSAILIKNGINTVIVGKPNVGKSSLLNAMIGENKAIVTNIPGTTRDVVEASINLDTITIKLIDTAGIRITKDIVEKIGVEKSLEQLENADLILHVLDRSTVMDDEDKNIAELIKSKCNITVVNKADLKDVLNYNGEFVSISTYDSNSIKLLEKAIIEKLNLNNIYNKDITYVSNARQLDKLNCAINALNDAIETINNENAIDFVDIYIRKAWLYLGEIIGETSTDSLLDELFSKFCLGK